MAVPTAGWNPTSSPAVIFGVTGSTGVGTGGVTKHYSVSLPAPGARFVEASFTFELCSGTVVSQTPSAVPNKASQWRTTYSRFQRR